MSGDDPFPAIRGWRQQEPASFGIKIFGRMGRISRLVRLG